MYIRSDIMHIFMTNVSQEGQHSAKTCLRSELLYDIFGATKLAATCLCSVVGMIRRYIRLDFALIIVAEQY